MSDLSPECVPKRTFANASEFIGSSPDYRLYFGGDRPLNSNGVMIPLPDGIMLINAHAARCADPFGPIGRV
jgi:hypothetical protein